MKLIAVNPIKKKYWLEARAELVKHMSKYTQVEVIEIPESTKLTPDKSREVNSQKILNRLNPSDYVVVLDEHGKELTSTQLAEQLPRWSERSRPVFVIGGSHGLSKSVKERANYTLALSQMTLLHEMAQVMLLEQLYRALTIIHHKDYHK